MPAGTSSRGRAARGWPDLLRGRRARADERLGIRQVATVDRRHFISIVRPRHTPAFELLP